MKKCRKERKIGKTKYIIGIWFFVLVLILLVMTSTVLYYSFFGSSEGIEENVIVLVPDGEKEGALPEPTVTEGGDKWEYQRDIDLFETVYYNAQGEVVAQSRNGDVIIAPGVSNHYEFNLKNTGNVKMDFTMNLIGLLSLADTDLPFEVRIKSGDEWVIGSEDNWVSFSSLKTKAFSDTLESGESVKYYLEWRWPYNATKEQEDALKDLNDTAIGTAGFNEKVNFKMTVNTVATISPDAIPKDSEGNVIFKEITNPVYIPVVVFVTVMLSILLLTGCAVWSGMKD